MSLGSCRYTLLCFLLVVLSDALLGHSLGLVHNDFYFNFIIHCKHCDSILNVPCIISCMELQYSFLIPMTSTWVQNACDKRHTCYTCPLYPWSYISLSYKNVTLLFVQPLLLPVFCTSNGGERGSSWASGATTASILYPSHYFNT